MTGEHSTSRSGGSTSVRNRDELNIGKYRLIKTIGKGNFAKVKLARHIPTGREVIDKKIDIKLLC